MRGALWPLYIVVFRPGFMGLLSTCIAIAFLTIVWTSISREILGRRHGDDVEFGD